MVSTIKPIDSDVTCGECGGTPHKFVDENSNRQNPSLARVHILHDVLCMKGIMLRAYGIHPPVSHGEVSYATLRKSKKTS